MCFSTFSQGYWFIQLRRHSLPFSSFGCHAFCITFGAKRRPCPRLISLSIEPSPCLIRTSSARGSSINGSNTGSRYQIPSVPISIYSKTIIYLHFQFYVLYGMQLNSFQILGTWRME
jgi:hypothetical protein